MAEAEKKESSLSVIQIFLGIFFITYFLWYVNGGPDKWNARYQKIGLQEIKENISGRGVFRAGNN